MQDVTVLEVGHTKPLPSKCLELHPRNIRCSDEAEDEDDDTNALLLLLPPVPSFLLDALLPNPSVVLVSFSFLEDVVDARLAFKEPCTAPLTTTLPLAPHTTVLYEKPEPVGIPQ